MLQQIIENAGESGILLNDIYEYMKDTLPSTKSVEAKKRTLRYLLQHLKERGVICLDGLKWKATKR